MKHIESVTWPLAKDGESALTVVRIEPDEYAAHAPGILDVMAQAYDRQFGNEGTGLLRTQKPLLPDRAAYKVFDASSSKAVDGQVARMEQYTEKQGSVYWAAYDTPYFTPGKDMVGTGKASESRPGRRKFFGAPNCYVNDLAVTTPRRGTGSGVLWAAVSDFEDDRVVVADVLQGNAGFFGAAGIRVKRRADSLTLGEHTIPALRFEAMAVRGVRTALEQHSEWLQDRRIHYK